jgi:hypothetical protein
MEFKNNSCYLMELIYIKANQWKILRILSDFVFFIKYINTNMFMKWNDKFFLKKNLSINFIIKSVW